MFSRFKSKKSEFRLTELFISPNGVINMFIHVPADIFQTNYKATLLDRGVELNQNVLSVAAEPTVSSPYLHLFVRLTEVLDQIDRDKEDLITIDLQVCGESVITEIDRDQNFVNKPTIIRSLSISTTCSRNGEPFAIQMAPLERAVVIRSIEYPDMQQYEISFTNLKTDDKVILQSRGLDESRVLNVQGSGTVLFDLEYFVEKSQEMDQHPAYFDVVVFDGSGIERGPIFPSSDIRDFHAAYFIKAQKVSVGDRVVRIKPYATKSGKFAFKVSQVEEVKGKQ